MPARQVAVTTTNPEEVRLTSTITLDWGEWRVSYRQPVQLAVAASGRPSGIARSAVDHLLACAHGRPGTRLAA